MSPPAAKRDELVTVLLERLDRFEATLAGVQQSLTRMEASEEQHRTQAANAVIRLDGHEARLSALEASKHRAEGAAYAGRIVWALLVAGGAVAGFVLHYLVHP